MGGKIRVGVLFGGRSGEHEGSVASAASVVAALDPDKYGALPIGITRARAGAALRAIDCAGMARVDFFPERGMDRLRLNEINTIPGFTATSVSAKPWAASGVSYPAVIDRLIALALERHRERAGPPA